MDSGRLEAVPPGTVHLDTVRALHQTVVSLRTALEVSKNELKELKQKYEQHSRCVEYADVIEKLTLENHILRRKIIDSGYEDREPDEKLKLEVGYSPHSELISDTGVVIETATTQETSVGEIDNKFCGTDRLEEILEENSKSESIISDSTPHLPNGTSSPLIEDVNSQISLPKVESEEHKPSFKTKLELLSKFDVRIKVRTLKEGSGLSSTTSDSDSIEDKRRKKDQERKGSPDSHASFHFEEKREHFENLKNSVGDTINLRTVSTDNVKMAVPNEAEVKSKADKFDVQVRITSEENLVVKENFERLRRKDTLNLDVDDLSLRSMSEGDNSVFSEGGTTPVEPGGAHDEKHDQENVSGNESEEVDDIELIFTTDESKDISNLQEDLVSIRETDQWAPNSASTTHSTPVLIKFHTLDPDYQTRTADNDENKNREPSGFQGSLAEASLKVKRVSLPNDKEIRHVAFNGKGGLELPGRGILKSNKSDNMLYRKSPNASTRRLDSVDSLTCEYNRGLSFDNTKSSSFELGSSMDILHRDESVDSFQKTNRLGHRFSVFAATDISKCGISEDDLVGNLSTRRNTCPNPFQYRPPLYRGPRPVRGVVPASRARPVLREPLGPRRESSAQTDVSALPSKWTSDGYLAYKVASAVPLVPPTLPGRSARPPEPRTPRRTDEARRVLLSDIGFTSMVPELSRSAEPLWTLRQATPQEAREHGYPPHSPHSPQPRFVSRGSSYRSPSLSVDRSTDWISQGAYVPPARECRLWRGSLPDVRRDDTDELLRDAEAFVRRSIDNLRDQQELDGPSERIGQPYIPSEARQLRLGHTVKIITPQGRLAVGKVRYVGLAGGSAASSGVYVGAELAGAGAGARNDGTLGGRRYFRARPQHTALFVPFHKVVMAWAH
ncbi:uncharacterized protein [Epargyreus clarus]|uniref:uncharacterized protein n=1 Tax=Epargyreus clarus TaxID=520877 RepID=UPI003C2CA05D